MVCQKDAAIRWRSIETERKVMLEDDQLPGMNRHAVPWGTPPVHQSSGSTLNQPSFYYQDRVAAVRFLLPRRGAGRQLVPRTPASPIDIGSLVDTPTSVFIGHPPYTPTDTELLSPFPSYDFRAPAYAHLPRLAARGEGLTL